MDWKNFSHLWVLFVFHQTMAGGWRPTVRPPRLGGNARMGVFATRSTFRPNPIGMSLVELKGVRCQKDQVILELGSLDLVDGTPVVDIKPYLPFAEALPDASASYAQQAPLAGMNVSFTPEIEAQLLTLEKNATRISKAFIREVLAQDPRPAYRKEEEAGKNLRRLVARFQRALAGNPLRFLKSLLSNRANFIFPLFWHLCHTGKLKPLFLFQAGSPACSDRPNGTVTTCVLANICSPL